MSVDNRQSIRERRSTASQRRSLKALEEERKQKELEEFKNLLKKIVQKETEHYDERDVSLHPSYSKFQLPYTIKCRNRYNASKKLYERRFQYEIRQLLAQQSTGYEAARLTRHLCVTTLWPPLHSVSEITHTQRYFFSLSHKDRQRLNWIMGTNII